MHASIAMDPRKSKPIPATARAKFKFYEDGCEPELYFDCQLFTHSLQEDWLKFQTACTDALGWKA
jgi:hypothetical protein